MSSVMRGESRGISRRLVVQADAGAGVVCAGRVAEVFADGNRAVLTLERDGERLEELLLIRVRHRLIAVVNRCPHMERPLDDARLRGHVLTCHGHGRSYSLRPGRSPNLRLFQAWTEGEDVLVNLGPPE